MNIFATYEKDVIPEALKPFATEKDGKWVLNFDADSVGLATNHAAGENNAKLLREKQAVQTKYEALVTSSGQIATELNELRTRTAESNQVSKDELAILTAINKLKLEGTPTDIAQRVAKVSELEAKLDGFERDAENRRIAGIMGWKPNVLSDLRSHPEKGKDLEFEVETVIVDGKSVDKVYVKTKNASGEVEKSDLGKFAESNASWKDYLGVLKADSKQSGPSWLEQGATGGDVSNTGKSPLDEHIAAQNAKATGHRNPLMTPAPPPANTAAATT